MPSVPTNPILPDDPDARRKIYLAHRATLDRLEVEYGRKARAGIVLLLVAVLIVVVGLMRILSAAALGVSAYSKPASTRHISREIAGP